MIEYSNKKLLKNYPFSRAVAFCFVDSELSKKDKEYFESKIRKYEPLIKGVMVNKELSQIKYDSNKANITLTLHILTLQR